MFLDARDFFCFGLSYFHVCSSFVSICFLQPWMGYCSAVAEC